MIPSILLILFMAVCVSTLLAFWIQKAPRTRGLCLLTGTVFTVLFTVFWFPGFMIPGNEIVILQAGLSQLNILHVFGNGNHFCVTCDLASDFVRMAGSQRPPMENLVLLNRGLYVLSVLGISTFAILMTRGNVLMNLIMTAFFVVAYVNIPINALQGYTDYPSAVVLFLFVVGLLAGTVYRERRGTGHPAPVISVITLIAVTALAYFTRPEAASFGLAALSAIVLDRPLCRTWMSNFFRFLKRLLRVPEPGQPVSTGHPDNGRRNWFVVSLVALFVMIAMEVASNLLEGGTFPIWLIDGVNPLNPSTVFLFFHLVALFPLSLVLLALAGLFRLIRHPLKYLLLPLSMVFMLKTYSSAARFDLHTMFRMYSLLGPIFLILALWGLRDLMGLIRRSVPDARVRVVIAAVLIASFSANTPFVRKTVRSNLPESEFLEGYEKHRTWLSKNPQLETRFLLDLLNSNPECLFKTRVISTDSYVDVAFGRSGGRFEDMWFTRKGILDGPPKKLPECVLYYRSLDCNLSGFDSCDIAFEDFEPVKEITFKDRPYGDYLKVRYNESIVLGAYRQPDRER